MPVDPELALSAAESGEAVAAAAPGASPWRWMPRPTAAKPAISGIKRAARARTPLRISEAAWHACAYADSSICQGQCGVAALDAASASAPAPVVPASRTAPWCASPLLAPLAAARSDTEPLAILSHELRHRLNLIQVSTELLINLPEVRLSDIAASVGATILRAVASQARIVDDLLDLSRARTGKLSLTTAAFSISAMVEEIAQSAAAQAQIKGVQFEYKVAPDCPPVQGDAVRTEQIIWNLVSNALKFTPSGERISLSLRAEDGYAKLTVADTGRGIAPDFIGHVFEMFSQDKSHGEPGFGLGIGLSLVKELAEGQGGWVVVQSDGLGHGAVFHFGLPLFQGPRRVLAAAAERAVAALVEHTRPLLGLRILAVDDSRDALEPFAELLALEGAEVRMANDAQAAFALLADEEFDLLLSDISMQDMSGDEMLSHIRRRPGAAALPAIAVTGYHRAGSPAPGGRGFDATLTKPIEMGLLLSTIAAVVLAGRSRKVAA
jgi:two-component system CheB/CheR fusion protein